MAIGIIGGSGLYDMEHLKVSERKEVPTPFGMPSDKLTIGTLSGVQVIFLPRHGAGHRLLPSEINYRANIFALKTLGADAVISVSAVGSLREDLMPRDLVIPDQFFDRTNSARDMTFFGNGMAGHITFADPVCPYLVDILHDSASSEGARVHKGGCYINMEGPAFSTRAESRVYRSWGMDIIGMTNIAEARLAREAEMCYATAAFVTDYDCWKEDAEDVTISAIIANLNANTGLAKKLIERAAANISQKRPCECRSSLKYAVMTKKDLIPIETKRKLAPIIGRYMQD